MDEDSFVDAMYIAQTELNMSEEDFWNMSPLLFAQLVKTYADVQKKKYQK